LKNVQQKYNKIQQKYIFQQKTYSAVWSADAKKKACRSGRPIFSATVATATI